MIGKQPMRQRDLFALVRGDVIATGAHGIFRHVETEVTAPMPTFASRHGLLRVFR